MLGQRSIFHRRRRCKGISKRSGSPKDEMQWGADVAMRQWSIYSAAESKFGQQRWSLHRANLCFPSWLLQIVKRLLLWHAFSFFLPQLWSHNMYVRYSRVQIYQIRAPDLTFKFWLERLTCFSCRPGKASPGPGRNLDSSCKLGYCNPCRFIILVAGLLIKADLHTAPLLMILPSSARQRPQLREGSAVQSVPTWL